MDKLDEKRIRDNVRNILLGEAAYGQVQSQNHGMDKRAEPASPHDVVITDNTIGVMTFRYNPKTVLDINEILQKLEPYFEDIDVQYVGVSDDQPIVSINVKKRYADLLAALMIHNGFTKDVETWGDEMRAGKRVYSATSGQGTGQGTGGGYPMPILLGEYPGSGF